MWSEKNITNQFYFIRTRGLLTYTLIENQTRNKHLYYIKMLFKFEWVQTVCSIKTCKLLGNIGIHSHKWRKTLPRRFLSSLSYRQTLVCKSRRKSSRNLWTTLLWSHFQVCASEPFFVRSEVWSCLHTQHNKFA